MKPERIFLLRFHETASPVIRKCRFMKRDGWKQQELIQKDFLRKDVIAEIGTIGVRKAVTAGGS